MKCKNLKAGYFKGRETNENFVSAEKGCVNDECVEKGINYANGYFVGYDLISSGFDNFIPGESLTVRPDK